MSGKNVEEVVEKVVELNDEEVIEEEIIEGEDEEKPLWMQEEEGESVPVGALIRQKGKNKDLRGQLGEKDEENEALKRELADLKQRNVKATPTERPKRPRSVDFDTDEEHETAMDEYETAVDSWRETTGTANRTAVEHQRVAQQNINESVEGHYDRAKKLVADNSIKPEVYQKADEIVRQTVESILPKGGDAVVDSLISIVGEGSEKVMFYLGRNKAALNEFATILHSDKTGLKAAAYLGRIATKVEGSTKQTSRAPAPAPNANGDTQVNTKESALRKKYDAAHKANKGQEAWNLKKQAKAAGHDTSKW